MNFIKTSLVSIIITNFNGQDYLKECLDSVFNIDYPNFEVIFVDDASTDKSVEFVDKNYPEVMIIKNKKNCGFAKSNNIGVRHSNGKFLVLLNSDTLVDEKWINELVKTIESSDDYGIIGSKIYYYDKNEMINFAGGYINRYGDGFHIGILKEDNSLLNKQRSSFFICGASLFFRRELYNKLGLFDPIFFGFYEDVDFCWRSWIFGYKVIYNPRSFIYHKIGQSIKGSFFRDYLTERNKLRTMLKNYELKTLIKIIPHYFRRRLNLIYINHGYKRKQLLFLYTRTLIWNIKHLFSLITKRMFVQKNRTKNDSFIFRLNHSLEKLSHKIETQQFD